MVMDDALFQRAYDLLNSCKHHLRMCDAYIGDKTIGFTFMTLAYTDYSYLKAIDFSQKISYSSIQFNPFFKAFNAYKEEVEILITGPDRLTYLELRKLNQKLQAAISDLEKTFEQILNI